jgi:hypothetical protein
MAFHALAAVLSASLAAAQPQPAPPAAAPPGNPQTLYCLRIEVTGSILEPVRCMTREEWADQDVDVDQEWAKNGVRVIS